jgi:hypothetical protein
MSQTWQYLKEIEKSLTNESKVFSPANLNYYFHRGMENQQSCPD